MKMFAERILILTAAASTMALTGACGDGLKCPDEVQVSIEPLLSQVSATEDVDETQPGIQIDVDVSTNLVQGSSIELVIQTAGGATTTRAATTDRDGVATIQSVTLANGQVTLTATGSSSCGMAESAPVTIDVVSESNCTLSIREMPIVADFYAPIPVLNSTNDSDPDADDFQANLDLTADVGASIQIFSLDLETGNETEIGSVTATDGSASLATTLGQGQQSLRATCTTGTVSGVSATNTVYVDTIAPSCTLTNPAEGVAITPDFDTDSDSNNGIQFTWTGQVDGGASEDVVGEEGTFYRGSLVIPGTAVDNSGISNSVEPAEFTSPGIFPVRFEGKDRAQNICTAGFDVEVVLGGCAIQLQSPNSVVNQDSDENNATGLQTDVVALVGLDCVGQTATANCGLGEVSMVVPEDGLTTFSDVMLDAMGETEGSTICEVSVSNQEDFQTSDSATVAYDTSAPVAQLQFVNPSSLTCGSSIPNDGTVDIDGDFSNGIQIAVNVVAPFSVRRDVELTNFSACAGTCITQQFGNSIVITLEPGNNDIRGLGTDAAGNEGRSGPCNIAVADIALSFAPEIADGIVGSSEDDVPGGDLDLTICGQVSVPSATVTVTVDSGTPLPTTVDGAGNWCINAPLTLPDGIYNIQVDAENPPETGTNNLALVVDTVAPNQPANLDAFAPDRATVQVSWTASDDGNGDPVASYSVKYIEEVDFSDFPNEGTEVTILFPPSNPGTTETIDINGVFAGTPYYVGVTAIDAAGNESVATTFGPIIPEFDRTGAAVPPDSNDGDDKAFGYQSAGGDYNADGFSDVAVSAPIKTLNGLNAVGIVYIYYGSSAGLDFTTPDVTIRGTSLNGQFGNGLTRIDWDGVGGDDLAIGAPFEDSFNGGVYLYSGATIAANSELTTANADSRITIAAGGNALTTGGLGFSLAAGELNGAGSREDLIISAPNANGGMGGIVIVYGGSTNSIVLSDNPSNAVMNGAGAHYFENPESGATFGVFGATLQYLGKMRAGGGQGDVGIAPYSDSFNSAPDYMFVLRGRTTVPTDTISTITMGATDLRVNYVSADDTTYFADQIAGVEAEDGFHDLVLTGMRAGEGQLWIVDGAQTGTVNITDSSGFLTRILGAINPGLDRFASAVTNPAEPVSGDVNGDGIDDLVVAGGFGVNTKLFVWYGGSLPTGLADTTSAAYVVDADPSFTGAYSIGAPSGMDVNWIGDTNGDGLSDVCWADWEAPSTDAGGASFQTDGRLEVFWDDGMP